VSCVCTQRRRAGGGARRIALVAVVSMLAASQAGCMMVYHTTFHHPRTVITDAVVETPVRRTQVESVTGTESVRVEIKGSRLTATVTRECLETWETKRVREVWSREACEGFTWDTLLYGFTLGLPFTYFDLPFHDFESNFLWGLFNGGPHARAKESFRRVREELAEAPSSVRRRVTSPAASLAVAISVVIDGERTALGRRESTSEGAVEFELPACLARPVRLDSAALELDVAGTRQTLRPDDPNALLAALQGAVWSGGAPSQSLDLRVEASMRMADGRPVLRIRVRNEGTAVAEQILARFAGDLVFHIGRVDPGQSVERKLQLTAKADPQTLDLRIVDLTGRGPGRVNVVME